MFFHEVIHSTGSTSTFLRRRTSRYRMVLPDDATSAHVLDRTIDIYHKVLTSLGINKLFGFAKHLLVRPCWTTHGLRPSLNSSGRVLRAGKAALAHAKGLVFYINPKIGAGFGMPFTRRVDPPFSQRSFRGRSLAARSCRVLGLGPPTDTNTKAGRRDVDAVLVAGRRLLVGRREVRRGRRRWRRLVLAGRARRPLVVGLTTCAAHGAVPSLGGCLVSWGCLVEAAFGRCLL
mmetsp:Transcript_17525/g.46048  ORF Transcript_17525/g.46048 Transcript_17525/m.46048 type:complete len:232 (-) Transcript_17525:80-775(-)